jgi:hypothetical protein
MRRKPRKYGGKNSGCDRRVALFDLLERLDDSQVPVDRLTARSRATSLTASAAWQYVLAGTEEKHVARSHSSRNNPGKSLFMPRPSWSKWKDRGPHPRWRNFAISYNFAVFHLRIMSCINFWIEPGRLIAREKIICISALRSLVAANPNSRLHRPAAVSSRCAWTRVTRWPMAAKMCTSAGHRRRGILVRRHRRPCLHRQRSRA